MHIKVQSAKNNGLTKVSKANYCFGYVKTEEFILSYMKHSMSLFTIHPGGHEYDYS